MYRSDPDVPSSGANIGVRLANASVVLERNGIYGTTGYGIACYQNSTALLHNNTIFNGSSDGIYCSWSNVTMTENDISECGGYGVWCEFSAPPNAGVNGTDLVANNALAGNDYGKAIQWWQFQVRVGNSTGQGIPNVNVTMRDCNGIMLWNGTTDGSGYTDIVVWLQYEIDDVTAYYYSPYEVVVGGTSYYYNVEENRLVTITI
jgi:hypothetical protein